MKIVRARHMLATEMAGEPLPTGGPFASTSFWKTPLPANPALHASSETWRQNLCFQMDINPVNGGPISGALAGKATLQLSQCAAPCYVVPSWVPLQTVRLTDHAPGWQHLEDRWEGGVPLPPGWIPNNCSDLHVCVWDPSRDAYHEFWKLTRDADGVARARWGGTMDGVSTSHGHYREQASPIQHKLWGASGTSLPLAGGLVQKHEVEAGVIPHAIPMVLGHAWNTPVYPAQRDDGDKDSTWCAEGARLRFRPDVDIDECKARFQSSGLTTEQTARALVSLEALIVAGQTHGIITMDKTGAGCALKFRDSSIGQGGWSALMPGNSWKYMWALPWHELDVLDPSVSL